MEKRVGKESGLSYGRIVWKRFRQGWLTRFSFRFLFFLVLIAIFSDFIANEKPIYIKVKGRAHYPIIEDYLVDWGWKDPMTTLGKPNWKRLEYDKVIWAPIPYSAHKPDEKNMGFVGPFDNQNIESNRFRHWLGTDRIGRDLAAGMIAGTRIALAVGIIAMGIASLIGILLGLVAGYFGDDRVRASRLRLILMSLGLLAGIYWGFVSRSYYLQTGQWWLQLGLSLLILTAALTITYVLSLLIEKTGFSSKTISIPFDLIIMRMVEVVDAMPAILLILAGTSVIKEPSIYNVMIIIGLVSWTTITRFVRAEVIKVKEQDFIQATRALGFSNARILFRHIFPNSISPVLIVIAFGIAGAILAEATISFLGIGLNENDITWGYLLNQARGRSVAWWLAIFPGLAIFVTVTIFNLLGEGLTKALNPKLDR